MRLPSGIFLRHILTCLNRASLASEVTATPTESRGTGKPASRRTQPDQNVSPDHRLGCVSTPGRRLAAKQKGDILYWSCTAGPGETGTLYINLRMEKISCLESLRRG
jgi:hypothetical protein